MRVLVQREAAIGDVLLTTPVLRALRLKWPEARITVATMFPELFRDNPDVQRAVKKPPREAFDQSIDLNLSYERAPGLHIVDAYASLCGVRCEDRRPRIYPNEQDRAFAGGLLQGKGWASVHAGPSAWPGRHWPPEKFDLVSRELRAEGWKVALVGAPNPAMIEHDLDLRGKTSIHQLAAIMEHSDLFLGVDSFPMHLAAAFKRPLVAIFGCIDPALRLPGTPEAKGITAPLQHVWCLGCHHFLPAPRTHTACFRDRVYCMERLGPELVLDAVREVLAANERGSILGSSTQIASFP
jgi:ADP-heptose:LPS heptosyltransferase